MAPRTRNAPQNKAVRAAVYVRISQDRDGTALGVKRQREDCVKLVQRHGWAVAEVYEDNDLSAYSGKPRPRYKAMMEAVAAGEVDAIVAWHPDRLHRSPRELEDFIDLVDARKVAVATVQAGTYDLATPAGRMTARIVGATARAESEHKSERVRRQREQVAQEGRASGGRRGYGYTAKMKVVPEEARIIRKCIERYLAGESLRQICIDLNARGVPTVLGGGWTVESLRQILPAPRLAALRVFRGEVIGDAVWEPIIDRATHERVLARIGNPRNRNRGRAPVSLLSGILVCGRCGAPMRHNLTTYVDKRDGKTKSRRRYVCESGPGRNGCGRVAIAAQVTEDWIVDAVLEFFDGPELARALKRQGAASADARDAEAALREIDESLADLADLFGAGQIRKAEWLRARDGLDARRATAEATLRAASGPAVDLLVRYRDKGALRRAWPKLDTDKRRAVVRSVFASVAVAATGPGKPFTPERLQPERAIG